MVVELLAAADALLPMRPDLAVAVLVQAMEVGERAADGDGWLAAAGVAVAARGGVGDGRTTAIEVLAGIDRWGPTALTSQSARRLRVELALLAAGSTETELVRALVGPVLGALPDHRAHAAARMALARAAADPAESAAALRLAHERCPDDAAGRVLRAELKLVAASIARRDLAPRAAAEAAAEGLNLLSDGPIADAHVDLRMSLTAESIAALLDSGDAHQARAQAAIGQNLLARSRAPRRQRALLRLSVASALAGSRETAVTVADLVAAGREAVECDAPDLEAICRSALGAIHEQAGRLDSALEEIRAGVDAQHRDRDREVTFLAAVEAVLDRESPPDEERPAEEPRAASSA
ncbi:MAG: hypothetical protein L0H84_15245, partial [Pseudonocardia sp.]|nr:hypothetical protein [Pseudonocardia sp.]